MGGGGGIAELAAFEIERRGRGVAEFEPLAGIGACAAPRSCHDFREVEVTARCRCEDGRDAGAVRAGLVRGAGGGGGRVVAAEAAGAVVGADGGELGEQGCAVDAAAGRRCGAGIGDADVGREHGQVASVGSLIAVLGAVGACAGSAVAVGPGCAGIAREAEGKVVVVGRPEGGCGELCLILVVRRFGEGEAVPCGVGAGVEPGPAGVARVGAARAVADLPRDLCRGVVAERERGETVAVEAAVDGDLVALGDLCGGRVLQAAPVDAVGHRRTAGVGLSRGAELAIGAVGGAGGAPVVEQVVGVCVDEVAVELPGGAGDAEAGGPGDAIDEQSVTGEVQRVGGVAEADAGVDVVGGNAVVLDGDGRAGQQQGSAGGDEEGAGNVVDVGAVIRDGASREVEWRSGGVGDLEPFAAVAAAGLRGSHDFGEDESAGRRRSGRGVYALPAAAELLGGETVGERGLEGTFRRSIGERRADTCWQIGGGGEGVGTVVGERCGAWVGLADCGGEAQQRAGVCEREAVLRAIGTCSRVAVAVGPAGATIAGEAEGDAARLRRRCHERSHILIVVGLARRCGVETRAGQGCRPAPGGRGDGRVDVGGAESDLRAKRAVGVDAGGQRGETRDVETARPARGGTLRDDGRGRRLEPAPVHGDRVRAAGAVGAARRSELACGAVGCAALAPVQGDVVGGAVEVVAVELPRNAELHIGRGVVSAIDLGAGAGEDDAVCGVSEAEAGVEVVEGQAVVGDRIGAACEHPVASRGDDEVARNRVGIGRAIAEDAVPDVEGGGRGVVEFDPFAVVCAADGLGHELGDDDLTAFGGCAWRRGADGVDADAARCAGCRGGGVVADTAAGDLGAAASAVGDDARTGEVADGRRGGDAGVGIADAKHGQLACVARLVAVERTV